MDARFRPAQAAIEANDSAEVESLLKDDPSLALAQSRCDHPTLLQCLVLAMPPRNALEHLIAILAEQGAELTEPLIAAVGIDNVRAVAALLERGANIAGNGNWSPLEEALYWGSGASLELLLKHGAPVDNLRKFAGLGDRERIKQCFDREGRLLASAGLVAWPFDRMPIAEAVRRDPSNIINNALIYAAAWGQRDAAEELIRRGASVNAIPAGFDFAGTPLHYAALNNRREMVDWLLANGADPALRDAKVHTTAADWAGHGGHAELAEYVRLRTPP